MSDSPQSTSQKRFTAFSALPAQFPDPKNMKTADFLEAAASAVSLVERLGKSFAPVVYDMNGNIKKLRKKYEEDKNNHEFLEAMILKQLDERNLVTIDALQWLRRALHFISRFFENIISDSDKMINTNDVTPFVRNSYRDTLERYHGWLGSQLFNILSRCVPTRHQLFQTLALDKQDMDTLVIRDMREYTAKMSSCVQKLVDFYTEFDLESNDRV